MATGPFWSVVAPVERANLVSQSPSFERGTAGWGTIQAGTIGTTAAFQQFGAWSGSIAPTSNGTTGAMSPTFTASDGTAYVFSAYVRGANGIPYKLGVGDSNGANIVGSINFTGGGTWQRYAGSWTESGGATRRVILKKNSSADTSAFYIDAVQVEAGSLTTYLDGDQDGCYWLGAPHASQSVRSGTYRGGGSVMLLQSLGMIIDEEPGVGMPPQEITAQSYALLPGAEFQRARATERSFTLQTTFIGTNTQDLHITRRRVFDVLKIDKVDPQQPTRFWYSGAEGTVTIDAVYAGGGEFTGRNGFSEVTPIRFVAHDPYWYAPTQEGTALSGRVALGSANYIVKRDPYGRWGTLGANGSTLQGVPNAAFADAAGVVDLEYNNGTVFLCGSFGTIAGTAYNDIAMYYPASNTFGTLTGGTLGTNTGRTTRALLYAPWGSLYVGGDWIKAGGTFGAIGIAQWNGNWGTLIGGTIDAGAGLGSSVRSFDMLAGTLFFGGRFSLIGGTSVGSIAMWCNNAFGTLNGGGIGANFVRELVIGLDNAVYVTGDGFTPAGTACNNVTKWNGAWGSMGTGLYGGGATGVAIDVAPNGKIIAGGAVLNSDNGTIYNIAEWNGQQWSGMGSGLYTASNPTNTWVSAIVADQLTGDIYAGGRFNVAGGLKTPDGLARWNGYAWLPLDIDVSGQGTFNALLLTPDRNLYAAGSFQGTAQAAGVAQIYNTGMGDAFPVVKVRTTGAGTARVYQIVNTLTGDGIYLNYAIQPGEEITLTTEPGARGLTSSAFGNIFGNIIPGSNVASFRLLSGTNYISLFCDSGSVVASIYWTPRHDSADGGTVY